MALKSVVIGCAVLVCVWAFRTICFIRGVKTISENPVLTSVIWPELVDKILSFMIYIHI